MENDAIPPSSPPRVSSPTCPDSPFFEPQEQDLSLKSSSPPPLFSSDDSEESIDVTNYNTPRIYKNKRKGTWWESHDSAHNTPERKKSKFTRNFDSGVFMMSDSDSGWGSDNSPRGSSAVRPLRQPALTLPAPSSTAEAEFNTRLHAGLEQNEQIFDFWGLGVEDGDIHQIGDLASIIKNPPDPGQDVPAESQFRSMDPDLFVQLGHNKLYRLPPPLFTIHGLTNLSLRENQIVELPPHLAQLKNLQALDVSLNKIKYLPFEILQLLSPQGLLRRLHTMGNPLVEPMSRGRFMLEQLTPEAPGLVDMTYSTIPELDILQYDARMVVPEHYEGLKSASNRTSNVWQIRWHESWNYAFGGDERKNWDKDLEDPGVYPHHPRLKQDDMSGKAPRYMARTLPSFFNQAGKLITGSQALPDAHKLDQPDYAVIVELKRGTFGVPSSPRFTPSLLSSVPSLLTTSLHNAFKKRHDGNFSIENVREMLHEPIPHDSVGIFERALDNEAGGWGEFRQCHICGKEYVVARAEWVEFWSVGYGVFYPLKVSVCSWGCVPAEMVSEPKTVLVV